MTTRSSKLDSKKVTEFIETFKKESEQLVRETFPQKVLEIDSLFKQVKAEDPKDLEQLADIPYPVPLEETNNVNDPSGEPGAKKRKMEDDATNNHSPNVLGTRVLVFPGGSIPYNKFVHSYCEKAKPLMRGLMEHANMVRMWINFLIPKIEDGNNFGVSIQEDVVAEARQVESEAASYLDQISRYYLQRARIISKIAKYPHIEDYRQSIKEFDERQMLNLQNAILEMRNHYASLHDIIMKNIDKIKVPRSANAQNMY
ncbi:proteasome activator complex subunit 3-like isoform X2 [Physella acuta]|uniref:proteasome activator complex subunit 3-like isoform X2 n=1 Tax=Physella acuta TaxID=109671 RepID=UPI0027DD13E2|nr:proteasome activator complex subunit 3-like isoform X2 [Physella acuta]